MSYLNKIIPNEQVIAIPLAAILVLLLSSCGDDRQYPDYKNEFKLSSPSGRYTVFLEPNQLPLGSDHAEDPDNTIHLVDNKSLFKFDHIVGNYKSDVMLGWLSDNQLVLYYKGLEKIPMPPSRKVSGVTISYRLYNPDPDKTKFRKSEKLLPQQVEYILSQGNFGTDCNLEITGKDFKIKFYVTFIDLGAGFTKKYVNEFDPHNSVGRDRVGFEASNGLYNRNRMSLTSAKYGVNDVDLFFAPFYWAVSKSKDDNYFDILHENEKSTFGGILDYFVTPGAVVKLGFGFDEKLEIIPIANMMPQKTYQDTKKCTETNLK